MKPLKTLADMLDCRANDTHSVTFIAGQTETRVTYRELHARALMRLGVLQTGGVLAGDPLILLCSDNEQFIVTFWACILGGIVPVPVSGGISDEHKNKLFRIYWKLESAYLYTDAATVERLEKYAGEQSIVDQFNQLKQRTFVGTDDTGFSPGIRHAADQNDTAFIQFSSGSTSSPKGVVLTHRNLLTNIDDILKGCRMQSQDRMLSWMPLTHDMGLIGFHLTPVMIGIDHLLMPPDLFVRRPSMWLSKAQEHAVSILCSPNFGFQHYLKAFTADKAAGLELDHIRLIFNGAEPISTTLCEKFMRTLAPYGLKHESMFTVYGLAEASLAVTFPALNTSFEALRLDRSALKIGQAIRTIEDDRQDGVSFVNVGKPVEHCELMITDTAGLPLPETTIGHIKIRGDNVTRGYYREDALNAETITADGWLDTGDLGFMYQQSLYITGRAKDIIFIHGQNLYPHDVEGLLIQCGLAEYGKVAITSYRESDNLEDKLLCFIQSRADPADFAAAAADIKRLINQSIGVLTEHVIQVSRIPKTTSGKVQRYRLAEAFLDGDFDASLALLATHATSVSDSVSPDSSIATRLKHICDSQMIDGMTLSVDDNLFDIGISSLTLAQIHEKIENTWPDQIDITDLFDYPSIAALAKFLEAKLNVDETA